MILPDFAPLLTRVRRAGPALAGALTLAAVAAPLQGQSPAVRGSHAGPGDSPVIREGFAMGTTLRVELPVAGPRDRGLGASEAVVREVERMEELLSTWRRHTPLARANAAPPGSAAPLPRELNDLLTRTLEWSRRTGGAFDPRIGALVDAWDLRGTGRVPAPADLAAALEASGERGVSLSAEGLTRHHPAAWVDAGGFGKGAALASAADTLLGHGVLAALVDLGGQFLALGSPPGAPEGWTIAVAHPQDRGRPVMELRVRDVSVATSGTSERGVEVEGRRFGHLLDPRTGRPTPSWGSVTVVSADPLQADVLATAFHILGPEAGMALARSLPETGVLFLTLGANGLDASWNPAMERWLADTNPARFSGRPIDHNDTDDPNGP